jgi:hypothetical protein
MDNKTRKMNLIAYRAAFTDNTKITFEDVLEQLKNKLPKHADRIFSAPSSTDVSVAISSFLTHPSNTGTAAVFSLFQKDAQISTLLFDRSNEELEFNTQSAPEGEEYLDKNILLFAVEDMVISCGIGNRGNLLCNAICKLARTAGILPHTTLFNFAAIPRGDILKLINQIGVKQVDFDATTLIGSLPRSVHSNVLDMVFGSTNSADALKRRRENIATLSVKNSRLWKRNSIGVTEQDKNKWLDAVAVGVVQADVNSYTIILNDNRPIKSGSLFMSRSIEVASDGSSFNVKDAHTQMVAYYYDLQREFLNEPKD